jgi:hypothetical protein
MECDYLGIKGERKKQAREFSEVSQQQRKLVKEKRLERKITARGAIQKLNQIDIEYYEKLAPMIAGKKNNTKLGRILDKLRKKSDARVSIQKWGETRRFDSLEKSQMRHTC